MNASITANVLGQGYCRISIAGVTIAAVERLGEDLVRAPYGSPGFIDLQFNGAMGVDFSSDSLTAESAASLTAALWKTGVTSFCPTLVTSPLDRLERNLRILERAREDHPDFAASVACYHLEGPYLSPGPSHGAHDPAWMRHPQWAEFERLQEAAGGRIGVVTMAPELPGSSEFIRRAVESGVVVAIGHTDGEARHIYEAIEAGASLSTHLGNGCPELIHRHRAPLWAQLVSDRLAASMICDGFHLPPELVRAVARLKGPDRTVLVTDSVSVAGLPAGDYCLGNVPIRLLPTGQVVTRTAPSSMAGSTLTMDRAIDRYQALGGVSLCEAIAAASTNPARVLARSRAGSSARTGAVCGCVRPGEPANLALWRVDGGQLRVEQVYVHGAGKEQYHGAEHHVGNRN
jgi:N-acetylglucosamine-6-phosphate deacetylase